MKRRISLIMSLILLVVETSCFSLPVDASEEIILEESTETGILETEGDAEIIDTEGGGITS